MKKTFLILSLFLIFGLGLFGFWQYSLYQRLSETDMSCEGDWSYNVRCPVGSYCQSLGEGPLAGGLCQPFLLPLFNFFSEQKQAPIEIEKGQGTCVPKFKVETGPELTASEAYQYRCTEQRNEAECKSVDIYSASSKTFGDADGTPDCQWVTAAN